MGLMVVTGATSGIGAAVAARLELDGHQVARWDISGPGQPVDVADEDSIRAAAERLERAPDGVVLAAGVSAMAPLTETTTEQWEHQMRVNTFGVFACLRELLPRMGAGGSVVVVASVAGLRAAPLLSAYCASKFAAIGLVQSVAIEQGPRGVRVNAVCPMYVRTPMQERELGWESALRGITPAKVLDGYVARTPLGRIGSPEEIADAISFLLGHESRLMTGSTVTVTGGAELP